MNGPLQFRAVWFFLSRIVTYFVQRPDSKCQNYSRNRRSCVIHQSFSTASLLNWIVSFCSPGCLPHVYSEYCTWDQWSQPPIIVSPSLRIFAGARAWLGLLKWSIMRCRKLPQWYPRLLLPPFGFWSANSMTQPHVAQAQAPGICCCHRRLPSNPGFMFGSLPWPFPDQDIESASMQMSNNCFVANASLEIVLGRIGYSH